MSVAERETELVSGAFFRAASLPSRATTNITVRPSWASTPRFLVEPRSGYDWISPVVEALRELGELEENWNDEGAPPINPDSALQA